MTLEIRLICYYQLLLLCDDESLLRALDVLLSSTAESFVPFTPFLNFCYKYLVGGNAGKPKK